MEHKIFDDYYVDCNECQHYWNDTCDGVPSNKERACSSYIATKKVDLPNKIMLLERKVKNLQATQTLFSILFILVGLCIIFGG